MREIFAHEAVVTVTEGDESAPGAAVTVALCGHWEHEPPCPLAPHHTAAAGDGDVVRLRILFAADSRDEAEVRRRIDKALRGGRLDAPEGTRGRWELRSAAPAEVRPEERAHGERLIAS